MIPWFHRNRKRIMEEDTWSCSHGNVLSSLKSLVNTHNEEMKKTYLLCIAVHRKVLQVFWGYARREPHCCRPLLSLIFQYV